MVPPEKNKDKKGKMRGGKGADGVGGDIAFKWEIIKHRRSIFIRSVQRGKQRTDGLLQIGLLPHLHSQHEGTPNRAQQR